MISGPNENGEYTYTHIMTIDEASGDRLTPQVTDYLARLRDAATRRGETMAGTALAWVLSQRAVTSVLVGASSVEQLKENIKCITSPLMSDGEAKYYRL